MTVTYSASEPKFCCPENLVLLPDIWYAQVRKLPTSTLPFRIEVNFALDAYVHGFQEQVLYYRLLKEIKNLDTMQVEVAYVAEKEKTIEGDFSSLHFNRQTRKVHALFKQIVELPFSTEPVPTLLHWQIRLAALPSLQKWLLEPAQGTVST